jgi:VWFA-related protein
MTALTLWLALAGGGLLLLAGPQHPGKPLEEPGYRVVDEVRLVVMDVSVRDSKGLPVSGLKKSNFRVLDNGKESPLAAFAKEDAPVSIGLVVDCSGSMQKRQAQLLSATSALLSESNAADETFLVTFNDVVISGAPLPPGAILSKLVSTPIQGRTALYAGVRAALHQLSKGTRERKALVVISDGADNASAMGRKEILDKAEESHATIYTIGIWDEDRERDARFLKQLASRTGGESYMDIPTEDLTTTCQRIARDIRARYMLAINAAITPQREMRRLRVLVNAEGHSHLHVVTRPGYIATPVRETAEKP